MNYPVKRAFTGAMNKLLSECSLINTVNRANGLKLLTPMITFHEILWYVYLLPWDQVSDVIPDYTMDNKYSNYYYEKIRRGKELLCFKYEKKKTMEICIVLLSILHPMLVLLLMQSMQRE